MTQVTSADMIAFKADWPQYVETLRQTLNSLDGDHVDGWTAAFSSEPMDNGIAYLTHADGLRLSLQLDWRGRIEARPIWPTRGTLRRPADFGAIRYSDPEPHCTFAMRRKAASAALDVRRKVIEPATEMLGRIAATIATWEEREAEARDMVDRLAHAVGGEPSAWDNRNARGDWVVEARDLIGSARISIPKTKAVAEITLSGLSEDQALAVVSALAILQAQADTATPDDGSSND